MSRNSLTFVLITVLLGSVQAQSLQPDSLWTKVVEDTSAGYFTAVDNVAGGGFIAGGFKEGVYNDSTDAYWLVRFDSNGDTVWSKTYTGEGADNVQALQTLDGGFAIGGAGDPWLIKTDANGAETWRQALSTLNDFGTIYSFAQTADSGFIATGVVDSSNIEQALVAKTDKLGEPTWVKMYKGEKDQGAMSVTQTTDGSYAVAGYRGHPAGGGLMHGWLMKLNAAGDTLWTAVYGDTADAYFQSIVQTKDGGLALVGSADRKPDDGIEFVELYMVKTDQNGIEEWDGLYSVGFGVEGMAVIQTADSGFVYSGMGMIDTATFDINAVVLHTDKVGAIDWSMTLGGPTVDVAFDVVEISAGEYLLAGGTIDFSTFDAYGWIMRLGQVVVQVYEGSVAPSQFALHPNFPNPFNPATTVRFDLPIRADFSLIIYDLTGRQVNILKQGNLEAGHYRVSWPGLDQSGRQMPSGIYIARLQSAQFTKSIKMVLLK